MDSSNDLSEELIRRLSAGDGLEEVMASEIFEKSNLYEDSTSNDGDHEPDDIIIVHMDIREPLSTLKTLVEQKIGVKLHFYKFCLQDQQDLEPHKNLVDQCVKGEGLVQINVQIQTITKKINIVDVLKPTEAALAALVKDDSQESWRTSSSESKKRKLEPVDEDEDVDVGEAVQPALNWVLDSKFKREQIRLKIPENTSEWTTAHVSHWLEWAIKEFQLNDLKPRDWQLNGKELCLLTHEEFSKKLPRDPGNVFWTHLQLLKECNFVSVVHKHAEEQRKPRQSKATTTTSAASVTAAMNLNTTTAATPPFKEQRLMRKIYQNVKNESGDGTSLAQSPNNYNSTGSGNNGQVQLWQFLLEILTDSEHMDIIEWVGTEGEFKLTDPDRVARLWGEKKNKPAMNYEKLSRALRYYYDGDMISKVSGKRFAYKFDCDLKLLIGYDASELAVLVSGHKQAGQLHNVLMDECNGDA